MTNRQIKNGYVDSIDILLDDKNNTFFKFTIMVPKNIPVEMYEFKKPGFEISLEALMEFFNVKSWNDIDVLSRIRVMIDDGVLRAIGKRDKEQWLEVFSWNLIEDKE